MLSHLNTSGSQHSWVTLRSKHQDDSSCEIDLKSRVPGHSVSFDILTLAADDSQFYHLSLVSKRFMSNPVLGSVHASDLLNSFGGELRDYLIHFVNKLDPNGKDADGKALVSWPKYSNWAPRLVTFLDGPLPVTITNDDYRKDAINYLIDVELHNLL